ncbi:hypothetical protein EG328_000669 [Venturia inaequalis]|uniref:Uncharacterized protein n=2 Tax=Venturia inaequalis TaxID=5025 RepID=A0A8H3V2F1_VENIN|nr:hypothetical protein EG328_000669 [Venturia inaequalis]
MASILPYYKAPTVDPAHTNDPNYKLTLHNDMLTIVWPVTVAANLLDLIAVFLGGVEPDESLDEMEGELGVEMGEEM